MNEMCTDKKTSGLSLCIINFNGEKYLEETIHSAMVQKKNFTEILLIDNASTDRSIEFVKNEFPEIKIIQLDKNYGPAAARNEAFRTASSDRILFIDNDISLAENFSGNLQKELGVNPNITLAMPQVFFAVSKNEIQYNGADCHFLGHMILHNGGNVTSELFNEPKQIGSVVTACFLLDRKKWGEEMPFDESFFFNYEDHDFGLRTRIKGLEIFSIPSLHCYHRDGTAGLSRRAGAEYSKTRVYCLIRNRWQIILKNYQLRSIVLLAPALLIYEIFQVAGVIKKGWFIQWLKAAGWILFNFIEILKKRRVIQRSRRIPDREILKGGELPFFTDLLKSHLEIMAKKILNTFVEIYWIRIKTHI